ncbi:formimidoylglutamase [Agaribacter marinus]|uniref:Formimidoylglutamase n=1 Tax=Virgibacillus salarius TaxID=447199 RepID=A0A941DV79_9BACI|nr:formimidoylglutamase [Virgibacillus salarius]MBR7796031.1 formimidoylglutamase [Virgibacillus salarius]NAZ08742.1 formimidoylglutamase [Agaribacter marinus]WBX82060.1 formimidoylglutamase [Virgibacillus salarius]
MYKFPNRQTWQGRVDSKIDKDSFRIHQRVICNSTDDDFESAFCLVGFESDEGVRRNKGRIGAAKAPDEIRKSLGKLPYLFEDTASIIDVGNVVCEGESLEAAQAELADRVDQIFNKRSTPIILGGGHETLYGHYLGIRKYVGENTSIGIINIDAHFDLRQDSRPSSGTMFRQILEQDKQAGYLCLGIQPFGNTKSLFQVAEQLGCIYVLEESLALHNIQKQYGVIDQFCNQYDVIIVTLCTDSIASSAAPGVSAPSPFGLDPVVVRTLLRHIVAKENVCSFDISEVNPLLDENGRTTKLAAYLVAEVLHNFNNTVQ